MPGDFDPPRYRHELLRVCKDADQLHRWVQLFGRINVPRRAVCAQHDAPFDYLRHAYFEPTKDVVVWAPRGGGKTRLAAIATLLDLLHKPPVAVRILGGSLDQSMRMWEHLLPDLECWVPDLLPPRLGSGKRARLSLGSNVAVLTQSQRAVRGLRVQKLRCDEVEMFDPQIWEAAQLVTRSSQQGNKEVAGAIDALSTAHRPFGLMSRVLENAKEKGTRVIRWCLLEVLERCTPERDCDTCPLWDECRGVAKTKCEGFFKIDDAIEMKKRVSLETWNSEMLCRKAVTKGCVFPTFDCAIHIREFSVPAAEPLGSLSQDSLSLAMDFGFAMPFVCLWIESREDGVTYVLDEYVQEQRTTAEHLDHLESRNWGKVRTVACDPAGAGRSDQTAASNISLLRSRGYIVRAKRSQIVPGVELVRAALSPAHGVPRLFVHPRCKRLIRALQCYRYGDGNTELPLKDGEHDHLIDALRYHFVNAQRDEKVVGRRY